jgi:hypothetical protein
VIRWFFRRHHLAWGFVLKSRKLAHLFHFFDVGHNLFWFSHRYIKSNMISPIRSVKPQALIPKMDVFGLDSTEQRASLKGRCWQRRVPGRTKIVEGVLRGLPIPRFYIWQWVSDRT